MSDDFASHNIPQAAASNTKKYLITVYSVRRYFYGIFPYNLLPYNIPGLSRILPTGKINILQRILTLLDLPGGGNLLFILVTQVAGDVGRFTPVEPVINYLKHFNIKLTVEIPKLINFASIFFSKITNFSLMSCI